MTRILVVEDDRDIAELVSREMEKAGFEVEMQGSGSAALKSIAERPPDLLILDWMLPDVDGPEICRIVRANDKTAALPIIMLTARDEEADHIVGLQSGADEYVKKPLEKRVLVEQVRALLRRSQRQFPAGAVVTYGPIVVDADRHIVSSEGKEVVLTAKEFLLLQYLLAHKGRVLSRDVLLSDVWGYRYTGGTRTVDVHVRRLREKLPTLNDVLVTVKQFGYKLLEQPPA
jgi:DNA-binding response OmpR family regulator